MPRKSRLDAPGALHHVIVRGIDRANRELGISTMELAKRLKIAQPTVTQSVARGEKVVAVKQLRMLTGVSFSLTCSDYLNPALEDGWIERTQPDSPRSPTQRYRLTRKGRQWLLQRKVG